MLLVYGFTSRSPRTPPSLTTYTTPNLTTNHIDANGNLILPHSNTPPPSGGNTTNQTASINRNSSNSSTSGGDPAPLAPIPLEPNRTIINTTTNRTKPPLMGN